MQTLSVAPIEDAATLTTLQMGLEWFPDGIGGGSSRFFSTLVDHFEAQGVAVHAIATGRASTTQEGRNRVRLVSPADASLWQRVRAARTAVGKALCKSHIDVVGSHFPLFTFACLDLLKQLPIVVHFQGPWAQESRFEGGSAIVASSKFLVEKTLYSRAARAIVLTRAFRDVLHQAYGVPLELIRVIPGGVDANRFNLHLSREHARLRLGLPLNRPIIVAVRRLARRMGLDDLIDAFARVKEVDADPVLVIVGSGRLSEVLKRQAQEQGLADSILFTGRVSEEDLPLYYRAADISIVPSVALEGFGLVVVESLACGTPVLVTPIGGLPEVVDDLCGDLILEGRGSDAIARGLRAALAGGLRLPSADACAAYARERYSWPTIARQVKSVYREVL